MQTLVTIAVPLYKRLQYLPRVLQVVASQTYPAVELLISDNGTNGPALHDQVKQLYPRPFKFRQNPESVDVVSHFNQMLQAASGEYFVLLADDDQITSEFVSELLGQILRHPGASVGFGRQETIDESGAILAKSVDVLPDCLSGPEFIMAAWRQYAFGFQSVSTFVGKTEFMREGGGYPSFTRGTHIDDAMVARLCLRGSVVFSSNCAFRNLVQEASLGWSVTTGQLAAAVREFMRFLDTDPAFQEYAAANPVSWRELRECLRQMSWGMYLSRWQDLYRRRLPYLQWAVAGFALPFIPQYYKSVLRTLLRPAPPEKRPTHP